MVASVPFQLLDAVRLGNAAGVTTENLIAALNAGSGRSAISEVNYPKWVMNGENALVKDIRRVLQHARLAKGTSFRRGQSQQ